MEKVPLFATIIFIATTLLTVWLFFRASGKSKFLLGGIILWMIILSIGGINGFYRQNTMPPRLILLIGPGILLIAFAFVTKRGRAFVDSMDIKQLTLLHTIRIPVEFSLYYLFLSGTIPVLMTFEGYNYDIASGITAPAIYYLAFIAKKINSRFLLVWNFISLALLLNVVIIAILSAQTPFQRLAFEQPNTGITYFPFVWLPGVVVPIVLFSHLSAIRQLLGISMRKERSQKKIITA